MPQLKKPTRRVRIKIDQDEEPQSASSESTSTKRKASDPELQFDQSLPKKQRLESSDSNSTKRKASDSELHFNQSLPKKQRVITKVDGNNPVLEFMARSVPSVEKEHYKDFMYRVLFYPDHVMARFQYLYHQKMKNLNIEQTNSDLSKEDQQKEDDLLLNIVPAIAEQCGYVMDPVSRSRVDIAPSVGNKEAMLRTIQNFLLYSKNPYLYRMMLVFTIYTIDAIRRAAQKISKPNNFAFLMNMLKTHFRGDTKDYYSYFLSITRENHFQLTALMGMILSPKYMTMTK